MCCVCTRDAAREREREGARAPLFHGVGTVSGRAGGLCAVYIESISPIKYIITAGLLQNCATDTRTRLFFAVFIHSLIKWCAANFEHAREIIFAPLNSSRSLNAK
jgi:hypothetical protein